MLSLFKALLIYFFSLNCIINLASAQLTKYNKWFFGGAFDSGFGFSINFLNVSAILSASLENYLGDFENDWFNINRFVGNKNGELYWGGSGFVSTCNSCSLYLSYMDCLCKTSDLKSEIWSSINLNERLYNINANIVYDSNPESNLFYNFKSETGEIITDDTYKYYDSNLKEIIDMARNLSNNHTILYGDPRKGFNNISASDYASRMFSAAKSFEKNKDLITYVGNSIDGSFEYHIKYNIDNSVDNKMVLNRSWHNQMKIWNETLPEIINPGDKLSRYIETDSCVGKICSETNAVAEYTIKCNDTDLTIILYFQKRKRIGIRWKDQDAYNECYDIEISGEWEESENTDCDIDQCNTNGKYKTTYIDSFVIVGDGTVPSFRKNSIINIKLIKHEKGTRYPVAYSRSFFDQFATSLLIDNQTGIPKMKTRWNKFINSIRIPPGFKLIVFENENYGGRHRVFTSDMFDLSDINFKETISSYILIIYN